MHLSGDESGAGLAHALAYIAPKSRGLLVQMEFEVYGNLHGIYYTKYAKDMSKTLNVTGWIRFDNKRGSVLGQIEGDKDNVDKYTQWLKKQGAPGSRIDKCEIRSWRVIDTYSFRDFKIRF